jgi:Predicted amino acid racemase
MNRTDKYPLLEINLRKIYENARIIVEKCRENGVSVSGVIKGFNAINCIVKEFVRAGCDHIASSRLEQLIELRKQGMKTTTMLIRLPMESEIEELVKYVDISLNSEWETIELIEKACSKHKVQHGVVLMYDLGDLREGFFDTKELVNQALYIENNLNYVKLMGIGTNLGCYGSIKPTSKNLGKLSELASSISSMIGRKLEIVSGGGTTSLPLLFDGTMPAGINNLRIGEAILLNRDLPDLWNTKVPGMHQDTFILKAQIIEIKDKPTYPIGELYLDAFGNKPIFHDKGIRKKALLAVGKQDFVQHESLIPREEGVKIIGSSSDHLIVDIEDSNHKFKVGDITEFYMFYSPMLYLCSSEWVKKKYQF